MQQYAKAISALVTPLILMLVLPLGLNGESTIIQFIEAFIVAGLTAISVYIVPNKK